MFGGFGDYFFVNRGHRNTHRNHPNSNDFIDIDDVYDVNDGYHERNQDVMRYRQQQSIPKNSSFGFLNNYMSYMKGAVDEDRIRQQVITDQIRSLKTVLEEGSLEQLEELRDNYLMLVSGITAKIRIIEKSREAVDSLHKEALFEIFKQLPQKDLVACSRVCKKWSSTCDKYFMYLYKPTQQFVAVYNMLFSQYTITSCMKCAMICTNPSKVFYRLLSIIPIYEVLSNIVKLFQTAHEQKTLASNTKQKFTTTKQFKGVTTGSFVGEEQYEIVYKLDTGVASVCDVKLYGVLVIDDLHMKSMGVENIELYVKSVYDPPISHIVLSRSNIIDNSSIITVIDVDMINTYAGEARAV